MEKWADDSRDCGHHWGHLGNCDSALYHRCSVLLSASGTPRDGEGDQVGVEPEGWICRGSHLTRIQDRVQRVQPDFRGGALQ